MYETGTSHDFENRLHQLPTGLSDLLNFQIESGEYTSSFEYEKVKWAREMDKSYYELVGSGAPP